jgi:cobalt-precorrin 5A hydrolase
VVDEAGTFAISVLGGHGGGANALTNEIADALGMTPVITTASDALRLPALDLIGQEWGWKIERRENLKTVSAAMLRGDRIAVYQETGRTDWWQSFGGWPPIFQRVKCLPQGRWAGVIAISDIALLGLDAYPTVVYRPPTLVLGVGCRRGVPCSEIESMFQYVCQTRGFSPLSLGLVATVDLKADEPGLREFVAKHAMPLRCFSKEELAAVSDIPTPSERVRQKIGISGVAEPAAMLAAGTTSLVMEKYRGQRITMAVARRADA